MGNADTKATKASPVPPTPKVYMAEECAVIQAKLTEAIVEIGIQGLFSRIELDTTGKIPTACWIYNSKTNEFTIKVGIELAEQATKEELRLVVEHELLHHIRYRKCDIRNPLMSNVVLDVAINKTLYLYDPHVMTTLSSKIYNLEDIIQTPVVLGCPLLDATQIDSIQDDKLREAYIEIWGSRKTINDFDMSVPVPLNLYYKLCEFVPVDIMVSGPFGSDQDEGDSEGQQDGDPSDSQSSKASKGKGKKSKPSDEESSESGEGESSDEGEDESKSNKPTKTGGKRIRYVDVDDKEEAGQGEEGSDSKDSKKSKSKDAKGQQDKDDSSEDDTGNGESDGAEEGEKSASSAAESSDPNGDEGSDGEVVYETTEKGAEGFSDLADEIEDLDEEISESAKGAGKGASSVTLTRSEPVPIDGAEIDEIIREREFEETIAEVGELVEGAVHDNIKTQVFATRPTRTTLVHMACGVTDYIPVYNNRLPGQGKPKIEVYADISGSMRDSLRLVQGIMVKLVEYLPSAMYVFHDTVMPMPTAAWAGFAPCGGGTNFNNVLDHACRDMDSKREWLEKWFAGKLNHGYGYTGYSEPVQVILNRYNVDYGIVAEDCPVVMIITDGSDSISDSVTRRFADTGKTLIVLHIVDSENATHPFGKLASSVLTINRQAQIIKREHRRI